MPDLPTIVFTDAENAKHKKFLDHARFIRESRAQGHSLTRIARAFGVEHSTVVERQMPADARVLNELPDGWVSLGVVVSTLKTTRATLGTLAAAGELPMHCFGGHRVVPFDTAKALIEERRAARAAKKEGSK